MRIGVRSRNDEGQPISFDGIISEIRRIIIASAEREEMLREDANICLLDLRDLQKFNERRVT